MSQSALSSLLFCSMPHTHTHRSLDSWKIRFPLESDPFLKFPEPQALVTNVKDERLNFPFENGWRAMNNIRWHKHNLWSNWFQFVNYHDSNYFSLFDWIVCFSFRSGPIRSISLRCVVKYRRRWWWWWLAYYMFHSLKLNMCIHFNLLKCDASRRRIGVHCDAYWMCVVLRLYPFNRLQNRNGRGELESAFLSTMI